MAGHERSSGLHGRKTIGSRSQQQSLHPDPERYLTWMSEQTRPTLERIVHLFECRRGLELGGRDQPELLDWFDRTTLPGSIWSLSYAKRQLEAAGLQVTDGAEVDLPARFADVGALAYYLQAVPWQVPDFDINRDREHLARLQTTIERTERPIEVSSHRFWLTATKPTPDQP